MKRVVYSEVVKDLETSRNIFGMENSVDDGKVVERG